ncbi:centriolar coiled-coil protein of 110 kDa isoform X2 [Topomyia yanbarensis]|uniref:centriolar coiled-coil protein of 110 kDa isoform X2 n=1 Tax=Topomyia yanbarensis TaxID=2498891 RepID=UPI00273CD27A|nr:centriolar coiled-coil protein of 110 kDa isoform X2 [Topomyia yanbarensis]
MNSHFISFFKINGVPILPPLITPEIRAETIRYRQCAQDVEHRIQESKKVSKSTEQTEAEPLKLAQQKTAIHPGEPFSISRRNSFTIELTNSGVSTLLEKSPDLDKDVHNKSYHSEEEPSQPRLIRSNSYTLESPSPLLMKHMHNQCLNIKSTNSLEEISKECSKQHIKRLDFESEAQQLVRVTTPKPAGKPKWTTSKKVPVKSATPLKKYKSPYESSSKPNIKIPTKTKTKVPRKEVTNVRDKNEQLISTCQRHIKEIQDEHDQRLMELLKRQQDEQHELQESFHRQQEELTKKLVPTKVDQIHTSTPVFTSPNESTLEEVQYVPPSFKTLNISSKQFVHNDSQSSISNLSSQTLFVSSNSSQSSGDFEDSNEMYKTCENNSSSNRLEGHDHFKLDGIRSYIETIGQSIQDKDLQELSQFRKLDDRLNDQSRVYHHAASLINAYARGYLTRRLFQTERVQKVVEIIRDTLLFILDMHHENPTTRRIRSPADIQLKRTLVHQLTSACNQLHRIFIESTVKQRMEIICEDREKMRRKLVGRPRTSSSVESNRSAHSKSSHKQYRKLQMCSLSRNQHLE